MIITEELFIIPYLLLIIDLSAFSAPLSRCMENKDISIVAVALSWIEDPEFIESSERLAEPLISSFSLTRVEALTIVIIEAMCNHNVIATKKKIREVLTSQFEIKLTDADKKSIGALVQYHLIR